MTKKIFLIAGEPSGDALGAGLIRALRAQAPESLECVGIGGEAMEAEGLKSLLPISELSVMGIMEVLWQLPRLLNLIHGLVEEIEEINPDLVITVDFPDFNFALAKRLKKRGIYKGKIVHYVAPTVWAWRPGRAKAIAQFLDGLICLFPFEPAYFTKHGLKAVAVGHPVVESGTENADPAAFRAQMHILPDAPVLGLFLGSREGELDRMAGVLKESAEILKEQIPDLVILVPTLEYLQREVSSALSDWDAETLVTMNPDTKWSAFAACDVGLAVSGTVGLELAYMGVPHVIAYKMNPLTWAAVRTLAKVKFAHLGNILLGRAAIPEFIQNKCASASIAKGVLRLFKKDELRAAQVEDLKQIRAILAGQGEAQPSAQAAAFALSFLK